MVIESLGELSRRSLLASESNRKRAKSTQGEVGLHHPRDGALRRSPFDEFVAPILVGHNDRSHEQVGMAADVLGRGVHDRTGSQGQRLLQHRRGKGVVDDGDHAGVAGGSQYRRQVRDAKHRVGRGLEPEHVGAVDRFEYLGCIDDVDGARVESAFFFQSFEETARAVVSVAGKDDGRGERQRGEERGHGGQPRGERDAVPAFKLTERLFEGAPGRIAPTTVANVAAVAIGRREGRWNVEGTARRWCSASHDSERLGVPLRIGHHISMSDDLVDPNVSTRLRPVSGRSTVEHRPRWSSPSRSARRSRPSPLGERRGLPVGGFRTDRTSRR